MKHGYAVPRDRSSRGRKAPFFSEPFFTSIIIGLLLVSSIPWNVFSLTGKVFPQEVGESDDVRNAWGMFLGGPEHNSRSNYSMEGNPGKIINQLYIGADPNDFSYGVIDDRNDMYLYAAGDIYSYSENVSLNWKVPFNGLGEQYPALDENGNLLMRDKKGSLYCFDTHNGSIKWTKKDVFNTNPTIGHDGNIYIIRNWTVLTKMDIYSNEIWNVSLPPNNISSHAPTLDSDGNIYLSAYPPADDEGQFYSSPSICCFFNNGSLKWKKDVHMYRYYNYPSLYQVEEPILSIGNNKRLYVAYDNYSARDSYVDSIFSENGTLEWSLKGTTESIVGVTKSGTIIYISGKFIKAVDERGKIKWSIQRNFNVLPWFIIDSEDNIFLYGFFCIMIDKSGNIIWDHQYSSTIICPYPLINKKGEIIIISGWIRILGWTEPSIPNDFSLKDGNGFVQLIWKYPQDDGGAPVLNYTIYKGSDKSTLIPYKELNGSVLSFNDTDVVNGNTYYYSISARNRLGESNRTSVMMATPLSVPSSPKNLSVWIEGKHYHLEWEMPDDLGGAPLQNYFIYRGISEGDLRFLYTQDPSQTFKDDGSVIPGVRYFFAITAKNKVGESPLSDIVSSIMRYAPTQPMNVTTASGIGYVNVSWNEPEENGGSEIVRYEIFRSQGTDGNYSLLTTVSGETRYFNDTTASNGILYSYKVRCNNSYFDSVFSKVVTGYPATVPDVPENINVASGDNYLEVSWEPPAFDGGYAVIEYFVEKVFSSNSTFIGTFEVGTLSLNDTNVTNGIGYGYRIQAVNQVGTSEFSNRVEGIPVGVPSIPIGANVRSGEGFVLLSWQLPEKDGGSTLLGYRVYRNGSLLNELGPSSLSYNDTTVENGKVYEYIITSFNVKGESPRIVVLYGNPRKGSDVAERYPPGVPRNLRYQLNQGKIVLNWEEPDNEGTSEIIGYLIYLKVGDIGDFELIGRVNVRSFMDANGSVPGTYYYRVSAFNSDGEGNKTVAIRVEIKNDRNGEPTPIWYYVLPIALAIISVIAIVLFVSLKKKNGHDGAGPDVNVSSEVDAVKEE